MLTRAHRITAATVGLFLAQALGSPPAGPPALARVQAGDNAELFADITSDVGLSDSPYPWPPGTYAIHEIMPGGIALFDYDNDGDLDLLQVRYPPPGKPKIPAPNRLLQQQSDGKFVDVTATSGLDDPGYGQGVAVGDVDNDGDLDVYVTNFGRDGFYRNNGDGSFVDHTSESGIAGERFSSSATFVDYDRDDDLDLFVVHYVRYDASLVCRMLNEVREYCGPQKFEPTLDTLYRNDGKGFFSDVTAEVGITSQGRGLGVVATDLTGDGLVDIFVANDGEANHLWVNNGNGTFVEEALIRGVALNGYGKPQANMGVTAGDANGDGRPDVFVTHLTDETHTLYVATPHDVFIDDSDASGFGVRALRSTGFGCGFFDYDNDGDLDLAIVNGRVTRGPRVRGSVPGNFWSDYAEPNILASNDGRGRFTDVSGSARGFTAPIEVSRGLAFGDLDRDGDVDLVASTVGNGLRVLRNDAPLPGTHWLRVRALTGKRDAIGARVTIVSGNSRWLRVVLSGYSYVSSSEPVAHFGLGKKDRIDRLEIQWPDGTMETFRVSKLDREITLRRGEGTR